MVEWLDMVAPSFRTEHLPGMAVPRPSGAIEAAELAAERRPDLSVPCTGELIILDSFGLDSAALTAAHNAAISDIARGVARSMSEANPVHTICLTGHTDSSGSAAYNLQLGQRRADAAREELVRALEREQAGLSARLNIQTRSEGETRTIAPDSTPAGRARNRRVEVLLNNRWLPVAPPRPGPPRPRPPATRPLDPARWTPIMTAPDLRTGNLVNFLVDGVDTFSAMHRAILTATGEEHYIYLLGWWLTDDFPLVPRRPGLPATIRELFTAASRGGVQVRAMLWDQFGRQNSAEVRRINALANGAAILDNHTFSSFRAVNVGSHHQKVLVVKGSEGLIAFCGGIDLNPDRIPAPSKPSTSGGGLTGAVVSSSGGSSGAGTPLHDVHCRVVGPSAHDLLNTFIRRWDAHPGHGAIDRSKGDLRGRREPVPPALAPTPGIGGTGGNCAVRITRTYNPVTPLAPGTTAVRERGIRQTITAAIQNARRFIYMEEQYLVNMEAAALLNAALTRIHHLTIVIPDSRISDMPRVWELRLNFITRLLRGPNAGKVRIFFLSNPPNTPGTPPSFTPHTYVHAKTWVIDDELAIIGSANCNQRGWTHDSEVNAVIFEDPSPTGLTFAQRLRMRLWSEHLNVPASSVTDGVASARLWTPPSPRARVRPYNPRAGRDGRMAGLIPIGVIDPAGPP